MYVESTKNKLSWDFAQEFKLVWFSFYSLFSIPCSSHKIFGRPTCLTKQEILNLKLRQIKRITSKLKENWNSYQPQQLTITPAVSFSTFNLLGGMINVSIKLKSEIKGLERHSVYQAKSRKLIMFEKTYENWMLYSQKRNLPEILLDLCNYFRNHCSHMVLKDPGRNSFFMGKIVCFIWHNILLH